MANRRVLEEAIVDFGDPLRRSEYFRLYASDVILHGYQGVEPGLESVRRFYYAFWNAFPDARVTVQDLIEVGDTLAVRYLITGTQHQSFMEVAPRGQRIELPGMSILHFRNGRCFERWTCSDSLVLMNQIGMAVTFKA